MKKTLLKKLLLMTMIFSTSLTSVTTSASWIKDNNGWWNTEGTSWSTGWRNINNKWYYFDPTTGYMQTGWINDKGNWYFANTDGDMQTGWVNDSGTWYFTNQDGAMQTGIIEVDGNVYCLANNGAMLKGNVIVDGKFYTFDDSGRNINNEKPLVSKVFTKDELGGINENQNIVNNNNVDNSIDITEDKSDTSSKKKKPSSSSNKKEVKKIEKIETVSDGVIKVYLNEPTSVTLSKDAFSISCPGFSDMTIFSVETPSTGSEKNRVYTVKTAYYDDKIYILHVTLPSGTTIDRQFEIKNDCPLLTEQKIMRTNENKAEFSYISDAAGDLYYIVAMDKQSRSFFRSNSNFTVDDILNSGEKSPMKVGYNKFNITGLENKKSYTVYYVAKDIYGKFTPIKTISINSEVISDNENSKIKIESIKTNKTIDSNDMFNSKYWFTIELSEATDSPLKLDNFTISCPKGDLKLGDVKTQDNKTYNVYMKQGYQPFDNITATATILFNDKTSAKKEFYIDMAAPQTKRQSITRTSDDAVQLELEMSEPGTLYYLILDYELGTGPKDPTSIYENGITRDISYGANIIDIEDEKIKTGKYIAWAAEDEYDNRASFFDYEKIPAYKK